jgi:hypothetical protein
LNHNCESRVSRCSQPVIVSSQACEVDSQSGNFIYSRARVPLDFDSDQRAVKRVEKCQNP